MDMPLDFIRHCNCNKSALINGLVSLQPWLYGHMEGILPKGPYPPWQIRPFWQDTIDISYRIAIIVFIWGQFWPLGIVVACICVSIPLCVSHELVYKMTHDLFKLGSPNLPQRCKIPWFVVWGPIDLDLHCQISVLPNYELQVYLHDNSSPVQTRITRFWPKVQYNLVKIPIFSQTTSQSWLFHSLNPLYICWSRQPRVIWHLKPHLLFHSWSSKNQLMLFISFSTCYVTAILFHENNCFNLDTFKITNSF